MIYCDLCLVEEAFVVVGGRLYCPDCYLVFAPFWKTPEILRAQPIERRKRSRDILPDSCHGLLPEDAY